MARTKGRNTHAELAIRSRLHALGLRFRVDHPPIKGPRRADIVFTKAKVAVFVNGCFWHGCPEHATWPKANSEFWRSKIEANRARDADTDRCLEAAGWTVIRVWEHEDPNAAAKTIRAILAESTAEQPSVGL